MTTASVASISAPADAHHRSLNYPCAVAKTNTWLYPRRCDGCRRRVYGGRAFRVLGQSGSRLRVWNLQARGWVKFWTLKFVGEAYCHAAGI
jgi:hypothetical protein